MPDDVAGEMCSTKMMGWWTGIRCFPCEKLFFNLTFGQVRTWGAGDYFPYKYGNDARASVFYNINSWLQWGVEYLWGQKHLYDGSHAAMSRIQTAISFSL